MQAAAVDASWLTGRFGAPWRVGEGTSPRGPRLYELLGHRDVLCAHVLNRGAAGVHSPLDALAALGRPVAQLVGGAGRYPDRARSLTPRQPFLRI
jgi:hypothetical protein